MLTLSLRLNILPLSIRLLLENSRNTAKPVYHPRTSTPPSNVLAWLPHPLIVASFYLPIAPLGFSRNALGSSLGMFSSLPRCS
jgi:hypothetical protein